MHKLVAAVMQREAEANVVVVDWLPMAQQLYPDAANFTHVVGLDIAAMLNWLQVGARSRAQVQCSRSDRRWCRFQTHKAFPPSLLWV